MIFLVITLLLISIFFTLKTLLIAYTAFSQVPYVPSSKKELTKAMELLDVEGNDEVLDIGSGDGRVIFFFSKRYPNTHFTGIDSNWILISWSKLVALLLLRRNVTFIHTNALTFDYSRFTKIYMYLIPSFIDKVMEIVNRDAKKDTVVISNTFKMGNSFSNTHKVTKYPVKYSRKLKYIYLWKKE